MCTYQTAQTSLQGSAKGQAGWFRLDSASVYFDHPQHALIEHSLNVDFLGSVQGVPSRVAVELDAESARRLAHTILAQLDAAPDSLLATSVDGRAKLISSASLSSSASVSSSASLTS